MVVPSSTWRAHAPLRFGGYTNALTGAAMGRRSTAAPQRTGRKNGASLRSFSEEEKQRNKSRDRVAPPEPIFAVACARARPETRALGSRLFGPWAVMDACSQSQCSPNTSAAAKREVNTVPTRSVEAADVSQSRICPPRCRVPSRCAFPVGFKDGAAKTVTPKAPRYVISYLAGLSPKSSASVPQSTRAPQHVQRTGKARDA